MSDIFIAHVEEDADIALGIAKGLEKAGYRTWCYEVDSLPGQSYIVRTGEAVEQSQAVVIVISPHSLGSSQVTKEVVRAHEGGKHFIPILRDITHIEFQKRQPEWREAIGSATSIRVPSEGLNAILPLIIEGIKSLGIRPGYIDVERISRISSKLEEMPGLPPSPEGKAAKASPVITGPVTTRPTTRPVTTKPVTTKEIRKARKAKSRKPKIAGLVGVTVIAIAVLAVFLIRGGIIEKQGHGLTSDVPPSAPTITSPGSSSEPGPVLNNLMPTLQWNAVSGADYYSLAISRYPYGLANIIYNPQQLTGTSHVVPSGTLLAGERYCWNMQAHGPGGWSTPSNTLYFQISTEPATTLTYTLTVNLQGQGTVSLSPPGGSYVSGSQVTLTSTPASGWQFSGWSGDLTGSQNPATITMNSHKSITATFAQPTSYGGVLIKESEEISPAGEIDSFTFYGKAGETILVAATETGQDDHFDLSIEVFDPSGKSIAKSHAGYYNALARVTPVLSKDGSYSIIVQETAGLSGPYLILVKDISPSAGVPIAYGSTVTGELKPTGDVDVYAFEGKLGETIIAAATETGEDTWFDLKIEVFDSSGESIAEAHAGYYDNTAQIKSVLTENGLYSIRISEIDTSDPHTGPYTLSLQKV